MDTTFTPQMLIVGGLVVLLLVAMLVRNFAQRRRGQGPSNRFGADHSQDIFEMTRRTQAEENGKECDRLASTLIR